MTGHIVGRVLTAIMALIATVLLVVVSWQIGARWFAEPTTWTEEASRWAFIWANFVGFIYLTVKNAHLTVDVISQKVRRTLGFRIVFVVAVLLGALSMALVAYGGVLYLSDVGNFPSKAMGLPRWWLIVAVPISFGSMAVATASWLVRRRLWSAQSDTSKPDEQVYGS